MAITRVAGPLLYSDLDRQGVDLQFTTDNSPLLYLDFAKFQVAIDGNTDTTTETFTVFGNAKIANILFHSASISSTIDLTLSATGDIKLPSVGTDGLVRLTAGGVLIADTADYRVAVSIQGSVANYAALPGGAANGDLWITLDDGHGWLSDGAGGWSDIGQIRGPQGYSGYSGISGTPGTAVEINGAVPDYASLPLGTPVGAVWITTDTGDCWLSDGSDNWTNIGPVQGPAGTSGYSGINGTMGSDGASGYSGAQGTSGYSGISGSSIEIKGSVFDYTLLPGGAAPGDLYIVLNAGGGFSAGDGAVWNGSSWDNIGPLRGPMGPAGASGYSGTNGTSGISGYSGASGTSGISGKSGYSGISGYSGASGYSGTSGISGYSGVSGISGQSTSGYSGASGTSGISGYSGASGTSGISGYSGASGTSGISGYSGASGTSGISGYSGVSGASGTSGISGYSGVSGISGQSTSGYSGASGTSGVSGYSGASGTSGVSGYSGTSGTSGISGYSGASGTSGISGYSGASGTSGISGYSGVSGYSSTSGYSGASGVSGAVGPGTSINATVDTSTATLYPVMVAASGSGQTPKVSHATSNKLAWDASTGALTITGTLYATAKSFMIAHPTQPNKTLVHGSLEGPENGVYVRGKTSSLIIELPEYWTKLVDPESITIQLTPFGSSQQLYVEKIENNKVYIANGNPWNKGIVCFYFIQGERIDIAKLKVETDNE